PIQVSLLGGLCFGRPHTDLPEIADGGVVVGDKGLLELLLVEQPAGGAGSTFRVVVVVLVHGLDQAVDQGIVRIRQPYQKRVGGGEDFNAVWRNGRPVCRDVGDVPGQQVTNPFDGSCVVMGKAD